MNRNSARIRAGAAALAVLALFPTAGRGDPASFLDVVRRYADTMLDRGRDTYGAQKTGLFLSALDRTTLGPLASRPAAPTGIRRADRAGPPGEALVGANPHLDENLYRILYTLTEVTGDARYAKAADESLTWFFNNAQSKATGLFPWGEHMFWNVLTDEFGTGMAGDPKKVAMHEFARPWMLWDRSYELAPEPCRRFALGLWEHQIANHETGGFDRHALYFRHGPADGKDFPRHAGFYIAAWGHAYKRTKDETFLKAIEVLLARFEKKRKGAGGKESVTIGPLDTEAAAACVPDPVSTHLKEFAAYEDKLMLGEGWKAGDPPLTPTWQAGYGEGNVLSLQAMGALARYEQCGKAGYRDRVVAIADAYRGARPGENEDVWASTFGHVISTEVAAYRITKRKEYLDEARAFAQMAVDVFWGDSPLPRASFKTGHYETLTGGDSLALSLLEVHAAMHDLKTPIPSNVIDR